MKTGYYLVFDSYNSAFKLTQLEKLSICVST